MSSVILSVSAVIDDLASYDRREVQVRGFLAVQHENLSIADDHRQAPSRSLWVQFDYAALGAREKDLRAFDRKTVIAAGIVSRQRKGHFSLFPATLTLRHLALA